jgi:hypothetical protein
MTALEGGEWQGRKDSNPRPSVLETDALTRLSYAPKAEGKVSIVRWLEGPGADGIGSAAGPDRR